MSETVNLQKITKPRTKLEGDALAVLRELVADVEAVGRKRVGREWPDLSITFNKAEQLLITVGTGGYQLIGISCDAYAEERQEIAELLARAAPLADAANLWICGQPADKVFTFVAGWLRERVNDESVEARGA